MEKENFRLACGLYEQVELWSMRRTPIKITYALDDEFEIEIEGIITDVFVKNKVEFIQIDKKNDIESFSIKTINPKVVIY